ncbi:MFS transporter [Phragmitibacter flavus]|uniref:MFS transporter n=1 Tax=Phragmitibacter flavus TaxID=2576071 RepID=A0A5R8KJI8_9BACT|nr:MFS transporter [Phragmitibacter flavus]TLD72452.1 MFS transporter [Phragmitibacter flavus]
MTATASPPPHPPPPLPPPTFRQSLAVFPRAFWILVGAIFVNKFGVFVLPFLTLFVTRKGYAEADAGFAAGLYSVGSFAAAMIGGWLADRFGRNITMAMASLGGAACMLGFSQADSLPILITLSLLTGFISESGNPASSAMVQDLIEPHHRINAYAVLRFAVNLGWCMGPAVAGWLAEHNFVWLFIGDAITSAFFGLIAWIFLPRGIPAPRQHSGWSVALKHMSGNRAFIWLAVAQIFLAFNFRQLNTSFPLHLDRQGHSLQYYGWIQALNGIMICTLELALLTITRHLPTRLILGLGYAIMGSSFMFFFDGTSLGIFVLVMMIFTIGEMFAFSRQQAYIASLAHTEMRGRYSGFMSLAWCVGSSSSAMLGLQLYGHNPSLLWITCLIFGFIGTACLTLPATRATQPDSPSPQTAPSPAR